MCGIGFDEQMAFYDFIKENIDKCEPDESLTQLVSIRSETFMTCSEDEISCIDNV